MECEATAMTSKDEQEAFFMQQYPRLAGWAAALLGEEEAGRDVASEAFARLLPRWERVDDRAGFLYAVAANLARDRWRRAATHRRFLPFLVHAAVPEQPGPDTTVRDLVDRLPDRTRVPVLLHYYADMPADTIAAHLGKPPSTVRRLLAEGRAALRQALEDQPA
jgi:RNA polymerase sigma-70 factor (ECF subfamily)